MYAKTAQTGAGSSGAGPEAGAAPAARKTKTWLTQSFEEVK